MNQFSKYDPFSNDKFFKDNKSIPTETSGRVVKPSSADTFKAHTFLFPLNESEEFHDPFSEINLFLARRIKREILREKTPSKWSRKVQSLLLKEILPDFTTKFPGYRLGSTALQKTWNKVLYYLQTIQQKKGALKPNGKLNIEYLIKENLKSLESSSSDFHPYNTAHSLAVKISECIAAIDGDRPRLEELTKTIWAIQKHLIANADKVPKAPFDTVDSVDKLIVRFQLEELSIDNLYTKEELAAKVKKRLLNVKGLERIKNIDEISPGLMALLAEKLYPHLSIHKRLDESEISKISTFIKSQLKKAKFPSYLDREKAHTIMASRVFFLYKLASQTSLEEVEDSLQAAIKYVYSLSTDSLQINTPVLKQEVYDFIDQEISYLKEEKVKDPLQKLLDTMVDLFAAAEKLPRLEPSLFDELEIVIWKVISEESECLAKLPGYIRRIILEELASVHIDQTKLPFRKIVQATLRSLKSLRNLDLSDLDNKLEIWSHQNDMIASNLYFDEDDPLLALIKTEYDSMQKNVTAPFNIETFIDNIANAHIEKFPQLSGWRKQLKMRITILFKYYWYSGLKEESESSFDRFVQYQFNLTTPNQEKQFPELLLADMEMAFKERIPLFPFSNDHCRQLVCH